jgi:hypothetical protein
MKVNTKQFPYIHLRKLSKKNIQYKICKENRSTFFNIAYKTFRLQGCFIAILPVGGGLLEKWR